MKIGDLFEKWNLTGLKVKTPILELDWAPSNADKDAAWDLYVELLTRVATQRLSDDEGVEGSALDSAHGIFSITRTTLKKHGRAALAFSRVAIVVLNQVIRPFTAKWHAARQQGRFQNPEELLVFREELSSLQVSLRNYVKLLADLADVEDLSDVD